MAENRMELFIETLTGAAFELKVSPFETIMSIKAKIQYLEGIPIAQQHLIWQTQELEDEFCLQDYSITDGATLKLVLGMRGGPINTRRVSVESRQIQDLSDYVEGNSEEISERLSSGQPLTVLVFHDGDKVHMYTVIDRTDSNISRLSGSVSSETSIKNLTDEEVDEETLEKRKENEITRQKMALLQQQMHSLSIRKTSRYKEKAAPVIKNKSSIATEKNSENASSVKNVRLPPLNPENKLVVPNNICNNRIKSHSERTNDKEIVGESCGILPLVGINNLCSSIRSNKSISSSGLATHKENNFPNSIENINDPHCMLKHDNSSSNSKLLQGVKQSNSTESLPYLPPAPASNVQSFGKTKRTFFNFQPHNSTKLVTLRPPYRTVKCSVTGTPSMASRRLLELDQWLNSRPKTTPSKEDQNYNIKWDVRMTSPLKFGSKERNLKHNPHHMGLSALVAAGLRVINSPDGNEISKVKSNTNKSDSKESNRPRSGQKLPPIKTKKKTCKRCSWCNKKTGLATSYVCRCGKNFCAGHRYAEVHHCSYDYKTEGRRFLQQTNPVVTAPKLPKI